jgi:uncharacterized phiE125 gp8 family phage protein
MEVVVKTDVSASNEPLLKALGSGDKYINQFLKYPTTGGATDELALIAEMCTAARELCEKELNKSLAEKTLTIYYSVDDAKRDEYNMELPYGPHGTIASVKVTYRDGTADTTLTEGTDYYVSGNQYKTIHLPGVSGTAGSGEINGYEIEIACGYGVSGLETIPEALRMIMAKQVVQWYAKRDEYNPILSRESKFALQQFTSKLWI